MILSSSRIYTVHDESQRHCEEAVDAPAVKFKHRLCLTPHSQEIAFQPASAHGREGGVCRSPTELTRGGVVNKHKHITQTDRHRHRHTDTTQLSFINIMHNNSTLSYDMIIV